MLFFFLFHYQRIHRISSTHVKKIKFSSKKNVLIFSKISLIPSPIFQLHIVWYCQRSKPISSLDQFLKRYYSFPEIFNTPIANLSSQTLRSINHSTEKFSKIRPSTFHVPRFQRLKILKIYFPRTNIYHAWIIREAVRLIAA